jgi:hypothetical protein
MKISRCSGTSAAAFEDGLLFVLLGLDLLLLLANRLVPSGPLGQLHPNHCQVNHRSSIRRTRHLGRANEVTLSIPAALFRFHHHISSMDFPAAHQRRSATNCSDHVPRFCRVRRPRGRRRSRAGNARGRSLVSTRLPTWSTRETGSGGRASNRQRPHEQPQQGTRRVGAGAARTAHRRFATTLARPP